MAQVYTRLGYLMDILAISGKELALEIGTDTTTISKWRNGQRKLRTRSDFTKAMSKYFLGKDFAFQRQKLLAILQDNGYDTEHLSEDFIVDALSGWITEEGEEIEDLTQHGNSNNENVSIQIYNGFEGWKEATNRFWEEISTMQPGQKAYIGDLGDIQWDLVEPEYIHKMVESILKIVRAGHKLVIIDSMTDEYKPYVVIRRWLPVYLSEHVEVRYIQRNVDELYHKSIYMIEDHLAISRMSIDEGNVENITMFYRDPSSVTFYQKVMNAILNNSRKLIFGSDLSNPLHMVQIMEENFKSYQLTYMINPMPTFRNMPPELLGKILEDNGVESSLRILCMEANQKRREIRNRCNYIQIYDLDELEAAIHTEAIIDYDLSRIVGKNVTIKQEYFREYLRYLSQITNTDTYHLILTSFRGLNLNVDRSSISVQDDSIVIAWNAHLFDRAIYCKELTVVGGYFQYLKDIWSRIPLISKNDKWTQKQFSRLLE